MVVQTRNKKDIKKTEKNLFLKHKLKKNVHESPKEVPKQCPICYENIKDNNYIVTKCNHIFCNDCLFKSLNNQSCCPICRREIFNFNKIKDLDNLDIIELETRTLSIKSSLTNRFVDEIHNIIQFSLKNNPCNCASEEVKNALNSYLSCHGFKCIFNRMFARFLSRYFSIISMSSIENLISWLKNNNN